MVPGVPLAVFDRIVGVAVLLLLGDEGPLLIELDLAREGEIPTGDGDLDMDDVAQFRLRFGGRI